MNKKKTHGALKNKEAFKGTLKQWGLISQAMLQGAENIDCFCDYTLTFSNVLCVGEREANWCVAFFPFLLKCVYLQLCVCFLMWCLGVCAFVHTCGSNSGRMERQRQLPKESWKGKRGSEKGRCTPLTSSSALSSCFFSLS